MGKFSEVCEKTAMSGHKISHSDRKSNRKWAPNVQRVRVMVGPSVRRLNVCTSCLRSGKVSRALPKVSVSAES
jgi:large subunit ribosomal protein L28